MVTNIEVFRRLYEAVGLGWVYAITKWCADRAYQVATPSVTVPDVSLGSSTGRFFPAMDSCAPRVLLQGPGFEVR